MGFSLFELYRRLFGGPEKFVPLDDVEGGRDDGDSELSWWQGTLTSFEKAGVGSICEYLRRYVEIIFSQVDNYMCISTSVWDEAQNANDSQGIGPNVPTASKCLNAELRRLLQDFVTRRQETNAFLVDLGLPFCKRFMSVSVPRKAAIIHLYCHAFILPKPYFARGTICENSQDTFARYSLDDHRNNASIQSLRASHGFCNWLTSQNNEDTILNYYKAQYGLGIIGFFSFGTRHAFVISLILGHQLGFTALDAPSGTRPGLREARMVRLGYVMGQKMRRYLACEKILHIEIPRGVEYDRETEGQGRCLKVTNIPIISVTRAEVDSEVVDLDF